MAFWRKQSLPKKLHIGIVTRKFPQPSREQDGDYLWPIARGLAKRGHDVTVLSWQNPRHLPEIITRKVHAYFLGEQKGVVRRHFPQLVYNKFLEIHQKHAFHIIHSMDDSALLIGEERKKWGVLMTYDVSATQMSQLLSILAMATGTLGGLLSIGFALFYKFMRTYWGTDRKILNTADAVFVSTPLQSIWLERYYMYPELKTFIVPYGIDHVETSLMPASENLKLKLGLTTSSQVVISFTDMTDFEEVANVLRAFQKVVIKKPNARLIIVGNGPLKSQIEYEMLSLALGSKTIFTGTIPAEEQIEYISIADIYINLSSRTSGFETTMLEAMAQNKVVIGSELSPIATIIEDGKDGFLVRPADIPTITHLITELFNQMLPSAEIGQKARAKVLDLFDVDKMVDQMLKAYELTLSQTGRRVKSYEKSVIAPPKSEASP